MGIRSSGRRGRRFFAAVVVGVALSSGCAIQAASAIAATPARLSVDTLTTQHLADPLGIDQAKPRLAWVLHSSDRGVSQTAYQIRVATTENGLGGGPGLVWDSRRVRSARSFDVPYGGRALKPRTRYYWQVRAWDNHGNVSAWSAPAWFETAFLDPSQFQGDWIAEYPDSQQGQATRGELLFRKQFMLAGSPIAKARLFVVGLSYPYISIDGRAVSDHVLDTAFTTYSETVDYATYDVTGLLHSASNAIALSLGHGFYAGGADDYPSSGEPWQPTQPKLKVELDVWYANGDSTRVLSDATWKVSTGPTTADSPAAETSDARLEKTGWNQAGYDDSSWANASAVSAPAGALRAQLLPPISKTATIEPVRVTEPQANTKVYDFGTTTSGWARITMQGTAGTTVYLDYSEKLNSDGTVESEGNGGKGQVDTYTLKGGGQETYEPKYGWKGYRYIEVTTVDPSSRVPSASVPLPQIASIAGVVAHTALPTAGDFRSSSDLLNRMHVAMRNTILNNQYSYGSDTPVYEKGGWTGDNGFIAASTMSNFDSESYYDHTMWNFDDSQDANGNIGWMVPTPPSSTDHGDDPIWGGQFLLMEYEMFKRYNDLDVVRRDYSHMAAYVDHISSGGSIYQGTTFGDWVAPTNGVPPSSQMIGSMFIYREAKDLAIMAAAIGNTAGATKYDKLAATIAEAVNTKFYDAAKHEYRDPPGTMSQAVGGPFGVTPVCAAIPAVGTTRPCIGYDQTANAVGLAFGLAPAADRQAIAAGLAADAVAKGDHLATGATGSQYLLPMLTEGGQGEEAYKVATNPTAPGWGQWFLQCGATTMWESWDDATCASARSRDHAFMGTVDDWLFADVAGIQATSPGFATMQIKPYPVGDLTSAEAHETTPLGQVESAWHRSASGFDLTVRVPVGAQAHVFVPAGDQGSVTESGQAISQAPGVQAVGLNGGYLELAVVSGNYRFRSTSR